MDNQSEAKAPRPVERIQKAAREVKVKPEVKPIVIPPNLEVITGSNAGEAGVVYIDRVNKKAYRAVDLTRYPETEEGTRKDFANKIEVAKKDTTGLTPRIYAYDSETMTMEMELMEGKDFTHNTTVSVEEARQFMKKLDNFHKLGLFHGDMFPRGHWFKTLTGEIRLIDPIYMPVDVVDSGVTVEKMQAMDKGLALQRFQEFGISEANIDGRFFEVKEHSAGELKTKVDENLEQGIKDKNIQFVYQRGIGFSDGNDPKSHFIETSDFGGEKPMFGPCVVLVARSPETKKTCMVHADKQTDLQAARAQMSQFFGKERVDLAVIGGQTDNSEEILNDVNATFTQEPRWKLNRLDILGEKFRQVRQVVVDTETGSIYDLQGDDRRNMKPWSIPYPDEIKLRAARAGMATRGLHIDLPIPSQPLQT